MAQVILSPTPPYTNCSALGLPRSVQLVSTDPECRVAIRSSPDGTTLGPAVVRVVTPKSAELTWDGSDFLTFVVTAGRDPDPIVAVAGFAPPAQGGGGGVVGGGGPS